MTARPGMTPTPSLSLQITQVVGLITDNDETAYREEVRDLAVWCQDNSLSLNMILTKEMIVDYRKKRTEHAPSHIDGAAVEQIDGFKFLGVHITNKLIWSKHTKTVVKRARQNLVPISLPSIPLFNWSHQNGSNTSHMLQNYQSCTFFY